ncbi:MAG: hypothetical protein GX564_10525 [Oligosphaeraceae bacterium]|nr:hypothetical protein [Oligosphaeraceae bacterium]
MYFRMLCILGLALAGQLLAQESFSYGDSLLAVVGEKVITAYEVKQAAAQAEARLPRDLSQQQREERIIEIRRQALNRIIEHELIFLEFQALKATVPVTVLQERLDLVIQEQTAGDRAKFEDLLYRENLTLREFTDKLSKNLAVEMLLYDRVNSGIAIPEPRIQAYYQEHAEEFRQQMQFRLQVIQLKKEGRYAGKLPETCAEIRRRLAAGEPFDALARLYSEGAQAAEGGDQGWMTSLNEKLYAVVKKLKIGECSQTDLELGDSIYLVKLKDFLRGADALNPDIAAKIRRHLEQEEEQQRYRKFIQELYGKYKVQRMDGNN